MHPPFSKHCYKSSQRCTASITNLNPQRTRGKNLLIISSSDAFIQSELHNRGDVNLSPYGSTTTSVPPSLVLDSKMTDPTHPMNALMRLNQVHPGLQYKLLGQSGPVHAPVFSMSVELQGTVYEASGASKKMAKLQVALKVAARRWEGNRGWGGGGAAGGMRLLTGLYTAALDGLNYFCSDRKSVV